MFKNFILLLACCVSVAALAACGANSPAAEGAESGPDVVSPSSGQGGTSNGSHEVNLDDGVMMRVLWTVSGYVFGPVSAVDEKTAQSFINKPLDVTDTSIIFDGQTCEGVSFEREDVNAPEYLSDTWKVTPHDLGIDVLELKVIKTNCSLPGFQEYMRLNDGRLIVPIDGVFYFFAPAVTY